MNHHTARTTRRSLHGVAELVLAGPQYAASGSIRLRVTPGGFGTVTAPDLRVEATELLTPRGRIPLHGTFAGLAAAAGVRPRALGDVYPGGPGVGPEEPVSLDPAAVGPVLDALAVGDAALRTFAPDGQPVLWPEHFDVGLTLDEVNYGVSPGDDHVDEPYAYVGPWQVRTGTFWNMPFGAVRRLTDLPGLEDVVAFFRAGAEHAAGDRPLAG